jgi:hypothetical protein
MTPVRASSVTTTSGSHAFPELAVGSTPARVSWGIDGDASLGVG